MSREQKTHTLKSKNETQEFNTSVTSATPLRLHNLNIYMYSFEEILELFELNYNISVEDLKRAKKKVLMTHPDKSNLSSEYFLFYKKAFDLVLNYYKNNNKQNQHVTKENTQYDVSNINKDFDVNNNNQISSIIKDLKIDIFQEKFNQLFEKNMVQPINKEKNDWFSKEEPIYELEKNISKSNMNNIIENIKIKNKDIVKYRGVTNFFSSNGNNYYHDNEHDDDDDETNNYISSDPFSKLKFDDLRKVHKDQTVFAVGENDFKNKKTFHSIEEMNRERGNQDLTPLQKEKSEKILEEQHRLMKEKMSKKEHESILKTKKYEDKNKSILSSFLQLT